MAKKSVGVYVCAKVLELQHTIKLIQILNEEIAEIEERIQVHMQEINSPLESIPGISFCLAAVIDKAGNIVVKRIRFANSHAGFIKLMEAVKKTRRTC